MAFPCLASWRQMERGVAFNVKPASVLKLKDQKNPVLSFWHIGVIIFQ
jgi:hypothetical protein